MRASPFRTIASAAFLLLLAACATDGPSVVAPPDDAALARETGVQLVLVSGGGQTGMVGHALPEPVVVRVLDQENRPVADARVNFIPPSDGAVDPRQARTDGEGYARATWTLGSLGEQVMRASGTGGTLLVTATAYAGGGTEIALLKTAGDEQTGAPGTLLRGGLQVRVLRDDGTPVQGAVLSWAVTSGGGSLDAAVSRSSAAGFSVRRWTLGPDVGTQSVTVSTPGAEPVTFTAQALNAALEKAGGDGQAGAPGVPLARAIQVRATRADGSPAAGIALTWTVASGGGSLVAASARTSVAGTAQARWTLGAEFGAQTVTVSAPGAEPVTFTATAQGLRLEKSLGDGQTAPAGTLLRTGLRVRVVTAAGVPVPGVPLTWTVASGGGSVDATESRSSVTGNSVRRWTLGPDSGEQTVTVSTPGAEPVTFTATATGGSPRAATLQLVPDSLVLDVGAAAVLTAVIRNAAGAVIPGLAPAWSSSDPAVAAVDSAGVVRGVAAGTVRVTATLGALSASATVRVRSRGPSLELFPDSLVLEIGVWGKLYPVARDASGQAILGYRLEWSTSSDQVVYPFSDGSLLPIAAGTARVTARWGDLTASVLVRVRPSRGALTIPQIQKRAGYGGSIDPSTGNVDLNWWIHVSQRNVSAVTMRVRSPLGRTIDCMNVDATHHTRDEFSCSLQVPRGAEPGTWRVDRVTVTKDGQTTTFSGADLDAMGTLGRAFDVFGTGADTQPPLVRMLWPHQGTRYPDTYYLQAGIIDHVSGVRSARMTVRGPGGVTHSCEVSKSAGELAKLGGGVCRLPLRPGSGTWNLVSVEVEDGAGNRAAYTPQQIAERTSGMSEAPFLVYSFTP